MPLPRVHRLLGPMIVAVAVQSIGNLAFHAVVGRWLSTDDYGALGTLLALTAALAVPLGSLQASASSRVVREGPGAGPRMLVRTALVATAGTLALAPLAPVAADFWQLTHVHDVLWVLPFAWASAVLATARGVLLGRGATGTVAAGYGLATVARLAVGIALTPVAGLGGALAATAVGELLALAHAARAVQAAARTTPSDPTAVGRSSATRSDLPITLAVVGGLFALSTVDLLLARHVLDPAESGAYVAAATIAKTVLAVPAALLGALYPRLVARARDHTDGLSTWWVAGLVSASAWAVAAVPLLAPQLVLTVLYGSAYDGSAPLVRVLVALAAVTATVSALVHGMLARGSRRALLAWPAALVEAALVLTHHDSALEVAADSAVAVLLALVLALAMTAQASVRGRRSLADVAQGPSPQLRSDVAPALNLP